MIGSKPDRRASFCDADLEFCRHAEQAAKNTADTAVKKVFAILGVDVDRPESVEEFREDLRFGRRLRKVADHGILVFVGIVAAALAAAVWVGIVSRVGKGMGD
jgi:hypothetical protein